VSDNELLDQFDLGGSGRPGTPDSVEELAPSKSPALQLADRVGKEL